MRYDDPQDKRTAEVLLWVFVIVVFVVLGGSLVTGEELQDRAYIEGTVRTSVSAHSTGDDTAETSAQFQASIAARVPFGPWSAFFRADTAPQLGAIVSATDLDVWQSGESVAGVSRSLARWGGRADVGVSAQAGIVFALDDGIDLVGTPKMWFGGAYARDLQTGGYLYVQAGIYEPVSARVSLIVSAHLPLLTDRTSIDVDLVAPLTARADGMPQSGRLIVGVGVRAFRAEGS